MLKKILTLIMTGLVIFIYIEIQKSPMLKQPYNEAPVITFDEQALSLSVKDDQSLLLKGVKAMDKEDGDLSSSIIIENLTPFTGVNTRIVNYIVFDSSDNVTRASRELTYKDYSAPEFSLTNQLRSATYSSTELMKKINAYSSVDGDISSKITVMNVDVVDNNSLSIRISVSDSTNTTSYLNVKYHLDNDYNIEIILNKYLIHLKAGESFDYRQNIKEVVERSNGADELISQAKIHVPNMSQPGVYEVTYTLEKTNGNQGKTTMIVIVE